MRVITDNPIIEDHSNAFGDKWKERRATKGKTSSGIRKSNRPKKVRDKGDRFFAKEQRADRKVDREQKREDRNGFFSKTNRDARKLKRQNRKTVRKGGTPLQTYAGPGGTKVYKEALPIISPNADGSFTKIIPENLDNDAEVVILPPEQITKIETPGPGPDVFVDKGDLAENPEKEVKTQINPTTGDPEAVKDYTEDEIELVEDEDTGKKEAYKKTDLNPKKGMSKGLKIGLIVGGVVVVGIVSYLIYKNSTKTAS